MSESPGKVAQRRELEQLEAIIEEGLETFLDVGRALLEIKERELYKQTDHSTFADYVRGRWGIGRHYAYRQIQAAETVERLRDGDNCQHRIPANEAQARPLSGLDPDEQREAWNRALQLADGEQPTAKQVRRALNDGDPEDEDSDSVHFSSEDTNWRTPDFLLERVLAVFGEIDLDPCAGDAEEPNVPARRHYTKDEDGLSKPWRGRVFMNPPYGRHIGKWTGKLLRCYERGEVAEAIALIPARTDTEWFRDFRYSVICFLEGRLKFSGHDHSAPFPSACVYLGPDEQQFVDTFGGPDGVGDVFTLAE